MVKTSKNHVKSYLAVWVTALMLMSIVAPAMTVSASSDLYASTETFSSFAIVDGTMTSDTGNAIMTFTNDATNGAGTFVNADNIRLQVNQKATYDPEATVKTTSSDAKMVYTLPEAISGKVEVSFQAWLKSGFSWVDAFTFMEAKDSKGNNLLNIGYEANNLYMGGRWDKVENRCSVTGCTTTSGSNQTHMNASNFVSNYRTAKFILDFDNGTITFYRGDADGNISLLEHNGHAYTLAIQNNAEDLKSLVFNFKGGCTTAATKTTYDSVIVLDDIAINQLAKSEKLYSSTEAFADLNLVNGQMTSDTGNATVTFTNDATKGAGTFTSTGRLLVKSVAPSSDAKMVYTLPQAISGKVEVGMTVYAPNYGSDVIADMIEAKNSEGKQIINIDFESSNMYLFGKAWSDENSCAVSGCTESGYNKTYAHGSNCTGGFRTLKFILDFDNNVVTWYNNNGLLTHGDPAHTYTMRLLNGGKDLKSLTFNFRGATSESAEFYLDDLTVTQTSKGIAESTVSEANVYLTADANETPLEALTAGDAVTVSAKLKSHATSAQNVRMYVALYNSADELVQVVFADNSVESGAEATLTKDLTVASDIGTGGYMRVFVWNQNLVPFDAVTELCK